MNEMWAIWDSIFWIPSLNPKIFMDEMSLRRNSLICSSFHDALDTISLGNSRELRSKGLTNHLSVLVGVICVSYLKCNVSQDLFTKCGILYARTSWLERFFADRGSLFELIDSNTRQLISTHFFIAPFFSFTLSFTLSVAINVIVILID